MGDWGPKETRARALYSLNLKHDERHAKWFDREHLRGDLKSRSISGGVNTVGAQVISFALTMASTVILARLLLPEDYGLVAMVTSITGFVLIFKDLGLNQAVIQKEEINQADVSKVFWLNFLVSLGLAGIIAALAPVLVWFYEEPRLFELTFSFCIVAVFAGLSAQHSALLNRQMMFKKLARITVVANFLGIATGILMAYLDFGYWSLVAINVVTALVTWVMMWAACDWRPAWVRIDKSIKEYVKFGLDISGFNTINYFSRNLDNILIGKFVGSSPLGLYNRAYQLLMLPISKLRDPLNAVGIPAMSSLANEGRRFASYFRQYVFLLSFFSMPITVFLAVCAKPIILIALGEKWVEASGYFQLLALVAFIQPVASTRGMVMISSGHSRRYLFWGLYNAIAVIIAFFIGIQWGIEGLIIAYALVNYLILVPSLIYCYRGTSVQLRDFFEEVAAPAAFSLLAGGISFWVYLLVQDWPSFGSTAVCFAIFSLVYLALWWFWPGQRRRALGVVEMARSILQRKKKTPDVDGKKQVQDA